MSSNKSMCSNDVCSITTAAHLLSLEQVVIVPSETVYGMAANAYSNNAVQRIYALKNRPATNPLIVHYASIDCAKRDVIWTSLAEKLSSLFWPGPLTCVLHRKTCSKIAFPVHQGRDTLAIRIPRHPVFQKILHACPFPLAAPSANPSGYLSPTRLHHVARLWHHHKVPYVEGDACTYGVESTVIDARHETPVILRLGAISISEIQQKTMMSPELHHAMRHHKTENHASFHAPGMLFRHYAPFTPLRLNATSALTTEAYVGFGNYAVSTAQHYTNLSTSGNLHEAAYALFDALFVADSLNCTSIAVAPIPNMDIGCTINERLNRAILAQQKTPDLNA